MRVFVDSVTTTQLWYSYHAVTNDGIPQKYIRARLQSLAAALLERYVSPRDDVYTIFHHPYSLGEALFDVHLNMGQVKVMAIKNDAEYKEQVALSDKVIVLPALSSKTRIARCVLRNTELKGKTVISLAHSYIKYAANKETAR